ncbi:sodium-coupled monocarboxylate transporter 1-like isoform X1 [Littorina saxatilis]|uniref:Sodium-coupled monocarboxylate transporter 1 n=1 Tax=Littorina saxatilis TaxID=31220 RepID=A0AAN9AZB3_9CAEN
MVEQRHFGVWDYVVFSLMLAVSAAIGIFYGCRGSKQKTTKEFLMANRSMSIVPVAISILVSFMSAILILGTPAEMYTAGTEYFVYLGGIILAIIIAAQVFVPLLYPLKLTSSFEYLELRFNSKWAKLTGTLILIVQQILYMGIASFAPSTALEAVTGFPVWATIIIVGLVSTFYTTLGGMKAVVWTDVFQSVVMLAGLLAIVIEGVSRVGGMATVWQINYDWERINFFDFNPDPTQRHSFWSLVVGGMVGWTATYGCNQASVQRYCALRSVQKAKISVMLNILGVTVLLTITCLTGIIIFAYYVKQGCDPFTTGIVDNSNQIIPYFVMEVLNFPGLPGLFISCLFSGALSTMSSCLNALAAVTWEDFLKPFLGHRLTEGQKTWVTKLLVLVFGGAGIGMAFMAQGLGGTVLQASLSFTGAASGPVLGLFLLGGLFPWANGYGAIVGGLLGLFFPLWISIGAYNLPAAPYTLPFPTNSCVAPNISMTTMAMTTASGITLDVLSSTTPALPYEASGIELLYTVSYLWYPSIGAATVIIVGLIVSFATGPMNIDEIDPKYLIPLFDRLFCCLPASWRRTLRCKKEFPRPEDIRAGDDSDVYDSEFVVPTTDEKPSQQPFTVMATDVYPNGKGPLTSYDSLGEKDVGNDAVSTENMSNGTYKYTTHL